MSQTSTTHATDTGAPDAVAAAAASVAAEHVAGSPPATIAKPRVILVGANGFGAVHLRNLERLRDSVELVALADPHRGPADGFGSEVPLHPSLDDALRATEAAGIRADIVIVATPIGTHADLAETAMRAGADVYVEKPPVASMADFERVLRVQEETGRAVQVGFQSLGSHALDAIAAHGAVWSVAAHATWLRDRAYWGRSPWAGKRVVDGRPMIDGVATNPLAHAVATALRIAGARRREDVASVEVELYRANDIEADDTTSLRVRLASGEVVSAALTLCAAEQHDPELSVRTDAGELTFWYTRDELAGADPVPDAVDGAAASGSAASVTHGRTDLFENLLAHRATGRPLLSSLVDAGAYMEVLEAIRTHEEPVAIDPAFITWQGEGDAAHPVVDDVGWWVQRTAAAGALFSEMHVPWAIEAPAGRQEPVVVKAPAGAASAAPIAIWNDGTTVTPTSSPRQFLHPIMTPAGVVVSDAHPRDHDWHLGLSLGLQHVDGLNFWGGRTYLRGAGYQWLDDHGRVEAREVVIGDGSLRTTCDWVGPDAATRLRERFEVRFEALPSPGTSGALGGPGASGLVAFALSFELANVTERVISLGSPGSNGRSGGGYGGLSWRLPAAAEVRVRTDAASGEAACHGSVAPWIAWSAAFADGTATVALAGADEVTRADPWFVRVADYPGIGSALAWDAEVVLQPGEFVARSFRGLIADGALADDRVAELLRP
ncbi:DUF6807 family protein [Leifsonia sp. Leaf264]|uniref:DUF6807 family protein n=1 Tax=Leifsonia sp. Leaf264 TaxID=1736314 RepID=UPI0006F336E5|nr:DUF6807 family protein [Leifsonia sp. Leaf264]KQO97047.1 hypothetical protein ASF30_18550 [Leifsonia sp. Leaf264]